MHDTMRSLSPLFGALAGALTVLLTPDWAAAHPVDEVVQGAYLTLAPGEVRLELDLTPGTEVSVALLKTLDADGDRRISDAEARAYGLRVLQQSRLTLDGAPAAWRLDHVATPPYDRVLTQTDTVKIFAVAARPDRVGSHVLAYDNRYQPASSRCIANIFLQPGDGWRYAVSGRTHSEDGRRLTVAYRDAR